MKKLSLILLSAISISAFWGCEKEPDTPPVNTLNDSLVVTIDSLRGMFDANGGTLTIDQDYSIYAVVTMDEVEGNIYKNLYISDGTAPANIRLTSSSDFLVGDSIRIALNGLELSEYAGVFQINNVDPDVNIIKQASGKYKAPEVKSITEITLEDEGKLIQLDNVQFQYSEIDLTYADAVNQYSENRYVEDCDGNTIYVRTSGFADFAGENIADGNGSMICIVSRFNDELQLLIRSYEEIQLSGNRCPGQLLVKDFDDNSVTSGGWIIQQVVGTDSWVTSDIGGSSPYVKISNYDSGTGSNEACENWLISPSLDLSASTSASFSFLNTYRYTGPVLEVLVSTDYPGTGDPNGYTWTALSPSLDTDGSSWTLVPSGTVDLTPYKSGNTRIAFKYTGSASDGSTWELDDIVING